MNSWKTKSLALAANTQTPGHHIPSFAIGEYYGFYSKNNGLANNYYNASYNDKIPLFYIILKITKSRITRYRTSGERPYDDAIPRIQIPKQCKCNYASEIFPQYFHGWIHEFTHKQGCETRTGSPLRNNKQKSFKPYIDCMISVLKDIDVNYIKRQQERRTNYSNNNLTCKINNRCITYIHPNYRNSNILLYVRTELQIHKDNLVYILKRIYNMDNNRINSILNKSTKSFNNTTEHPIINRFKKKEEKGEFFTVNLISIWRKRNRETISNKVITDNKTASLCYQWYFYGLNQKGSFRKRNLNNTNRLLSVVPTTRGSRVRTRNNNNNNNRQTSVKRQKYANNINNYNTVYVKYTNRLKQIIENQRSSGDKDPRVGNFIIKNNTLNSYLKERVDKKNGKIYKYIKGEYINNTNDIIFPDLFVAYYNYNGDPNFPRGFYNYHAIIPVKNLIKNNIISNSGISRFK